MGVPQIGRKPGQPVRKPGPKPKLIGEKLAAFDKAITDDVLTDDAIAAQFCVSLRKVTYRRAELLQAVANKRDAHVAGVNEADAELAVIDPNIGAAVVTAQSAVSLETSLRRLIDHADRMLIAADAWLRDPDDASRYWLGPRTTEVVVDVNDKFGRRVEPGIKRTLADLLLEARLGQAGLDRSVELREAKYADPRKLLLDAVNTLKPVVEVLGKARGELRPDGPVLNFYASEWPPIRARLVAAFTQDHPELLEWFVAVVEGKGLPAIEATLAGGGR